MGNVARFMRKFGFDVTVANRSLENADLAQTGMPCAGRAA